MVGVECGQQIGMRPLGVASLHSFGRCNALPHAGGFALALGVQMQSQQRFEGAFGGASYGAFASQHFPQLLDMRDMRHAGAPHYAIHPACNGGEQRFQAVQRLALLRRVGHAHIGEVDRVGNRFWTHVARLAEMILHGVHVNGNATGVFADQRLETRHQPWDGGEQPRMGRFLQCQERHDLIAGQIERIRVCVDVLRNKPPRGRREQCDALVEAPSHLFGEVAGRLAKLHGE